MTEGTELGLGGNARREAGEVVWFEPVEALGGVGRLVMTTRRGGISRAPYDSLNLGFHVSDVEERVRLNRRTVRGLLDRRLLDPVVGEQVHSACARTVGELHAGTRWQQRETALGNTDALITSSRRLPLVILVADCLPIALVDPVRGVAAAVHAGWRGLAGGILENTLAQMQRTWGSLAPDVIAWVGPGIGPCCYEVGSEVAQQFPGFTLPGLPGKGAHLDLRAAANDRLVRAGLLGENLTGLPLCTSCEPDLFFSHRRATKEGLSTTGRQAMIVWME